MIANLVVAFSGLMGFLTIFLILLQYRSNRITNIYLVIIFGIVSTRMVVIGTFNLENNDVITTLLEKYNNLLIVIIPCTYLYFLNLVHDKKRIEINNLKHFSIPFLFNLIDYALDNSYLSLVKNNFYYYIFFALYTIVYVVLNYNLLNKNIWNRKGEISIVVKQNLLIKNWSVFLFSIFLVNALRTIVVLFWEINNHNYTFGASFLWITAILWLLIYFKIIISPEILYGYTFLNSKINENIKSDNPTLSFWTTNTIIEITNIQDKKLNIKIKEAIPEYIKQIDQFSFHNQTFKNIDFVLSDLSNKLNIPKSHLNFLFKYHSKISFSEYKKIVRIHDSLVLINKGYLNVNTFDSLAKEVGFKSYNTFFVSFKDYTGVTPQEFLVKLIKNKNNS